MTKYRKKLLSVLLATSMVFTMNTFVFAEEVPADDASLASVELEAADGEATARLLSDGDEDDDSDWDEFLSNLDEDSPSYHFYYDDDGNLRPFTADSSDDHMLKNFSAEVGTDDAVTLKNVTNPVSWANIVDKQSAKTSDAETSVVDTSKAIIAHYEAGDLIETVLTGSNKEDTYLINGEKFTVSQAKLGGKMKTGYRTYDVVDLGSDYYLFVGYNDESGYNNQAFASDALGKTVPVFEYDGRTVAFDKKNEMKSTKSKFDRLNVDIALVKYENNTVKKIPGVTVGSVKINNKKKASQIASVSGQGIGTWTADNYKNIFNVLGSSEQPSFTITAKIDPKKDSSLKSLKKTITKALKDKDCVYPFEISQSVIDINNAYVTAGDYHVDNIFDKTIDFSKSPLSSDTITVKGDPDKGIEGQQGYFAYADQTEFGFDVLNISKFNGDKKKATIVRKVSTWNGKKGDTANIKLKDKTDYTLESGSLAGTDVVFLKFAKDGNYIYRDARSSGNELAGAGYMWAFRKTPSTDKKDKNKFRIGYYKDSNNGFSYSAE